MNEKVIVNFYLYDISIKLCFKKIILFPYSGFFKNSVEVLWIGLKTCNEKHYGTDKDL